MQRLEVSGAVRLIYRSLGVKGLNKQPGVSRHAFYIQKWPHFTFSHDKDFGISI